MARSIETDWRVVGGGSARCVLAARLSEDPTTVVDAHRRVLGRDGLHVADPSVCPEVPRATTNLPTMVAAERLAERIPVAAGERPAVAAGS